MGEDVQAGADPARDELGNQRLLVDDLAAGRVDETCAVAKQCEPTGVDQAGGIASQRSMDRDDVGSIARRKLRGQLVIARPFHGGDVDVHIGIVGVEPVDQRGDDAAFANGLGDIGVAAEIGIAGTEKAL